jgi:GR25 family glycosyltransferase involved in LPS biosynthesis
MRVNDFFDKVVVINLDRRPDRMEKLEPQLTQLGISWERFSAYDAKELDIKPYVAGTKSHVSAWHKYFDIKGPVLILEDDALFCEDFNQKFEQVMKTLPEDWDIFYLGALLDRYTGKTIPVNEHWVKQVVSTGTQAYCINPKNVHKFYDIVKDKEWFIDVELRLLAETHNAYITQPNLVTQFASYSDLREKDVDDF